MKPKTDPKPWVKANGDRASFPCFSSEYNPRELEEVVREEYEEKLKSWS